MLLSLNWLRDYLLKSDIKIDAKELAEKLTMRGLQVAAVRKLSMGLDGVVVGRIEKIEKHPNADRLQVTQVRTSEEEGAQVRQIVCGAKNIVEGDIVPVALPGAILPGDFEIKVSSIRGVESTGMLCSSKELGVSDDSEGILQLPKHSHLGEPISRLLGHGGHDDTLLEFELTPNRSDCMSVMGLAREIVPLLKTKIREPKAARFRISAHRTSSIIKVEVEDPAICPRYVARVIDGIKVTESPDWIKQRLLAVGIRPVNNVVDITNFVMMEYGQPLHAFDLRKLESSGIRVATCKQPMDFTLLNKETVLLQEGDILILDGDRPVGLAGIMGGANSQIEPDTTSIVLESAAFPPGQIRRTAQRLGLQTDASKRFEKGTDLAAVAIASERAAALLRDSFSANVYHPPIDTNEYGVKEPLLAVDMRDVRRITGLKNITAETVADLLDSIGIPSHKKSVNVLSVRLPTFRQDLKESIDLIEEVARLNGYDTIPLNLPTSMASYERTDEGQYEFEQRTRNILSSLGLRETIHYSFTSEENLNKYGLLTENAVRLQNPISEEMKVLRTSLLPSLLQTYIYNHNRQSTDQKLFEVAKIYQWDPIEETKVREVPFVGGLLSGNAVSASWKGKPPPIDFFQVKGLVEILVRQLTTVYLAYEPARVSKLFHPGRSAVLKLGLKEVGYVGEVHPTVRQAALETDEPVVLFELNLESLRKYERTTVRYKIPSKFPASEIDIAVTVDKPVQSYQLVESVRHAGGTLLSDVSIFDVYEGEHIPEGKKSIAFHLTFLSPERTLLDTEVAGLRERIVQNLSDKFGAQLRA
jgi:phenylalanyl-tRNA synthetase beta chain